jgi:hypothetical protein
MLVRQQYLFYWSTWPNEANIDSLLARDARGPGPGDVSGNAAALAITRK